ncbi:MAG: sulfate reduction electron transfer complex DsrMKJOP subunit DsrM [Vicinamibacterales bacterium]
MTAAAPLVLVLLLVATASFTQAFAAGRWMLAIVVPYGAVLAALAGALLRVRGWVRAPVPFAIPTTCGQQRSLGGLRASLLESPPGRGWAAARLACEVLLFRSLFRNTAARYAGTVQPRLATFDRKMLWLAALAFHYSLLAAGLRHLRFFVEPVPSLATRISGLDAFFEAGTPALYVTDVIILAALAWLLWRRILDPTVRFVSLATDYFALMLVAGVVLSGVLMRHCWRTDVALAKQWAMGLLTLRPDWTTAPEGLFLVHVLLAGVLVAWLPFGKLSHAMSVFLSPTRALANDTRRRRHVNPWNAPVEVRRYHEWEEEFKDKILAAGLPLDGEGKHA